MAVKDLQPRQGKVDITLDIVEKGEIRSFNKFGKEGSVCNATGRDDSGTIKVSLWNDEITKVNVGDKIKIINGYVNEWQGELQLSAGKFGKLEIVGKAAEIADMPKKEEEVPLQENTNPESEDEDLNSIDYAEEVIEEDM
ncbi:TPA: hypothetical protein HA246_03490 [Candidatus Woesearchaeota archaeon]|nr:hypothetical protein [Candidatus Woesearchaeota archaeon]